MPFCDLGISSIRVLFADLDTTSRARTFLFQDAVDKRSPGMAPSWYDATNYYLGLLIIICEVFTLT